MSQPWNCRVALNNRRCFRSLLVPRYSHATAPADGKGNGTVVAATSSDGTASQQSPQRGQRHPKYVHSPAPN
jgi:hypothetical protein